jgi:hypothetical protein
MRWQAESKYVKTSVRSWSKMERFGSDISSVVRNEIAVGTVVRRGGTDTLTAYAQQESFLYLDRERLYESYYRNSRVRTSSLSKI